MAADRRRFTPTREEQTRLIGGFLAAVRDGNVDALRSLLAADVVARADGGGKVPGAGMHPVVGIDKVVRLYLGLSAKTPADLSARIVDVNGAPAALLFAGRSLLGLIVFGFEESGIASIETVLNPDKLATVRRQLSGR